jgi:hypothetical protein
MIYVVIREATSEFGPNPTKSDHPRALIEVSLQAPRVLTGPARLRIL